MADSKPDPEINVAPPYKFVLSEDVRGYYGFKDGHVELEVDLPFPLNKIKKVFRSSFTIPELNKLKEGVDKAKMWADLPDFQRERDGVSKR